MEHMKFTATCPAGVELLVAGELKEFGVVNPQIEVGTVHWSGSLESAYRACLWSRFASRIFLQLAAFTVRNEDELYSEGRLFDWLKVFDVKATFAINTTLSGKTLINNNRYAGLKLKDAIADHFRDKLDERPSVQGTRPGVQLHLHLKEGRDCDEATVYLDMSGESLHRRGYRVVGSIAPLKETLAAAIVSLSGWKGEGPLLDPMCGSGTILIEAAMIAGDVAPGISRPWFGFFSWNGHQPELWDSLLEEAVSREEAGLDRHWPLLLGYDSDPKAVAAARKNIVRAGLSDHIQIKQAELATLEPPEAEGTLVSNLPFGERLSEQEVVTRLYRAFGRICKERFPDWQLAVFISNPDLTESFTLRWERRERLFNGPIACRLLCTSLTGQQEKPFIWSLPENPQINPEAEDFVNRLKKNYTKLQKWATKEGITCYRLYDRDLPEFNVALDLYGKWFHLQEFAAPKTVSDEVAVKRLRLAQEGIQALFGVRSDRIFVKRRERQRGAKQYERRGEKRKPKFQEVREGRAALLVNFTDYLDTGLFLDHRPLRQRIFDVAKGQRFLNLFGYTGSVTVQAALGGAAETTTVDLSANYLDWARKNLALNGFAELRHHLVAADCVSWLRDCTDHFDLIFLDPPTFSNTKKENRVFDIQRDHRELLHLSMLRLAQGGVLLFSTNFRRFVLDEKLLEEYDVKDISAATIPQDFQRNTKVHHCWEFRLQE